MHHGIGHMVGEGAQHQDWTRSQHLPSPLGNTSLLDNTSLPLDNTSFPPPGQHLAQVTTPPSPWTTPPPPPPEQVTTPPSPLDNTSLPPGQHLTSPGQHLPPPWDQVTTPPPPPPPPGLCTGGWYAFYWNAF